MPDVMSPVFEEGSAEKAPSLEHRGRKGLTASRHSLLGLQKGAWQDTVQYQATWCGWFRVGATTPECWT